MILEIATSRIKFTYEYPPVINTDYLTTIKQMYETTNDTNYDFELKIVQSSPSIFSPDTMEQRNGAYYRETDDSFTFKTNEWASTIYWNQKIMTVMFLGDQNHHQDELLVRSLKLLVSLLSIEKGGVPFHCSAVAKKNNSRGVVFYGPSNAGKTTIALQLGRTWNIYNDEFNILMPLKNRYHLYATPFTSPEKIKFCSYGSAPLVKLFSLKKGPVNKTEQLSEKQKYRSVLKSVYTFPTSENFVTRLLSNTDKICKEIPIEMLYFNLSGTIDEEIERFL